MTRTDNSISQGDSITLDGRGDEQKAFEDEVLKTLLHELEVTRQGRDEKEALWDTLFRNYHCDLDEAKYPWRSKVFDPESYAAVETIYPRIQNTMLGGPNIFGVKPASQEDVSKAVVSEKMLNYQADRMGLYEKLGEVVKDSLIYGTGIGKVYWRREHEPRDVDQPVTDEFGGLMNDAAGNARMKRTKAWVKTFDDPWVKRVDIKNLYVDPDATDFSDARFVIEESTRTLDYLHKKAAEGVYVNIDLIPLGDASETFSSRQDDTRYSVLKDDKGNKTVKMLDKRADKITLHERFGMYDLDGDGYLEEALIVVANGATVIRVTQNPFPGGFKPYFKYTPVPVSGQFYGMSPIWPIATIQDALNDRTNQIGDNINLILNRMYKVNRFAGIDRDQLISMPGGVVEMNSMQDMEPLETPDIIGSVFPEVGRYESKIAKTMGTYDYASGANPTRQEAATTVISLQQMAEIRFKAMTIMFERQVIRPLGAMMIKLNRALMGPEKQIRVLGEDLLNKYLDPEFLTVKPTDLVLDPDLYAVGATIDPSVNSNMKLENLFKFLGVVTSNQALMMNPNFGVDWGVILEELPRLMDIQLKRPLIIPINPLVVQEQENQKRAFADQMLAQQMGTAQNVMQAKAQGQAPQGGGGELPSRTKGELAKKEGNNGGGSQVPATQR